MPKLQVNLSRSNLDSRSKMAKETKLGINAKTLIDKKITTLFFYTYTYD